MANADVLHLPASSTPLSYNNHMAYWIDNTNQATLAQAQTANFQPLNQQVLPASKHPHWFKLSVQSDTMQTLTWVFANHWEPIDVLDVWVMRGQQTQYFALGDHRPFASRVIKSHLPAFPLTLAPREQVTIYLRAQGMSVYTLIGELSPLSVFTAKDKTDDISYGMYFGMLGMMALIAFLVGVWIKDHAMVGYSGYVLSFMLICFAMLGYAEVLFSNPYFAVSDTFIGLAALSLLGTIAWMWSHVLLLKSEHPSLHKINNAVMALCILSVPLVFSPYYAELHRALRWIGHPYNIIPPVVLFMFWRKYKRTEHLIYFLSFCPLMVMATIYVLMTSNMLPISLNRANLYMDILLMNIMMMSLGMALRVRQIQLDKVEANNKADLALQRTQEERRFVAMLSHEFRNPLATIDRTAQMLTLTNPDIAPAATKRFNNIRASVTRLSSLVDNFLMSERMEEGRLALHVEKQKLSALIEDIRNHFTDEDWARITLETCAGKFTFDLTLTSMAVSNLLHNALRYANPDASIKFTLKINKNSLTILVSDSGPGISEQEMAMLGTPYYRAANSYGKKGTGLGYYFCKRIVDLHGGTMTATKSPEGGLAVTMTLKQG